MNDRKKHIAIVYEGEKNREGFARKNAIDIFCRHCGNDSPFFSGVRKYLYDME